MEGLEAIANVYPIKIAKKQSNNSPSTLFRIFSGALSRKTSLAQTNRTTEDRMQSGISFLSVFRVMTIGANKAVQPTIISVLNILLPTTLPMAMSALPLRAEDTLTVSSGAEVPNATIVSPITMEGIRRRLATEAAPSVSPLAPRRMIINPPIRNSIFMFFSLLVAKSANGTTYNESTVTANKDLSFASGNDTNIKGGKLSGEKVTGNVGKDLNIESKQDSNSYKEKNKSVGASIGLGSKKAVSGSASVGKIDSNYKSVTDQSGIYAGGKGFDIGVGKNTDLKC